MAHKIENRISETSTSSGTGSFALAALAGYVRFGDKMVTSDTCWYLIEELNGSGAITGVFEFGFGTYSATNTLARTAVLGNSSGSTALINFASGTTKRVTMTALAPNSDTAAQWRDALQLGTGGNATGITYTGMAGPARSLAAKLGDMKSVYDFGVIGTGRNDNNPLSSRYATLAAAKAAYPLVPELTLSDQIDWAGTQQAWRWMNANGKPLSLSCAQLNINRPIFSSGYMQVDGMGAGMGGQYMAKGRIDNGSNPAPDLSYPSSTNLGPLDGCFIYVVEPQYYATLQNINFYDSRWGICHLNDPNSPIFRNLNFYNINAAVMYYLGCQNPRYYNCGGAPLGVLHMSSCTAFPSGSGREGNDNFYSDNCTFANEYGFNSFGIYRFDAFDAWFRDSIFRPNVVSTVQGSSSTYNDRDGNPYPLTHPFCLPTGRMIYMPYRNIRICFSLILQGQDSRGPGMMRGYAYVGTEIKALTLRGNQYEQLFEGLPDDDTSPAILTCGSITSGTIEEQAQISYIDKLHPFIAYTGRGQNEGFADDRGLFNAGAQPNLLKNRVGLRGYRQGRFYIGNQTFPLKLNEYREQYRTDVNAPLDAYYKVDGREYSDFETDTLLESEPTVLYLPSTGTDGKVRVMSLLRTYDPFCGYLDIQVRNCTTGEMDSARYYVTSGQNEQRTLANAVKNGDTSVTFTSQPSDGYRTMRYGKWSTTSDGTGKGFTTHRFSTGNTIEVLNRVSGLSGDIAAGTVMYRNRACVAVQDFQRGWVSLVDVYSSEGGIDYQGDDVIAIRNNMGNYNNPGATDTLEVTIRASHMGASTDRTYVSTAPTTGRWREGATVYRRRGASTPVLEWTCIADGTPGTWRASKWVTRSGNTASRPTGLTTSDVGVAYIDTTLSKMIFWTGLGWLT